MTHAEAMQIIDSFESGYVALNDPELTKASQLTGRVPRIVNYQSFANPENTLTVRRTTRRKSVIPVYDVPGAPFRFARLLR